MKSGACERFPPPGCYSCLLHAWQVDDVADRAVLNQIADMVVDLAVPATPPTTSTSAPVITGNIDAEEDENPLEPDADIALPLGKVNAVGSAAPVSKHDPENGKAAIGRDTDNVNGSDTACYVSSSAADDSPGHADSKPCLEDRSEGLDEATSGRERVLQGESDRCDPTRP